MKDTGRRPSRRTVKRRRRAWRTAKDLIGYEAMLDKGIAYLGDDRWSATMGLSDINYEMAAQERQAQIIDQWARFINTFDGSTRLQVTCMTRTLDAGDVIGRIGMPMDGGPQDRLRADCNRIAMGKIGERSRNAVTDKYLTLTISEPEPGRALTTLNRLMMAARNQLATLGGCKATRLGRAERLRLLALILRPGEPFRYDETLVESGRAQTKDFIAPWCIDATDPRALVLSNADGDTHQCTLWIRDFPPVMSDRLIGELGDLKSDVTVSLHLAPYDRAEGAELVNRKIAEMDMQRLEERRRNMRQHIPADEIPADLRDALDEANGLREEMRQSNERLINALVTITVAAPTRELLDQRARDVLAACRKISCSAETLACMQLDGLNATLPLGVNDLPMRRTLTTSGAAIMIPFSTQEIMDEGGVFYGANARSGNALVVDRTTKLNANGFILGTTGSGKSQAAKMEMTSLRLTRGGDDLLVVDPEHEYAPLCEALDGARVVISAGSADRINPMDIVLDQTIDGDPIRTKANMVVSMVGALVGGADGLSAIERSIIDRCALGLYREFRNHPGLPQPTLRDLHQRLVASTEPESRNLALSLESYTSGSLSGFAGQTGVDVSNRFTVFDVAALEGELKTFGMMVVLDHMWNRVARNRAAGRRTWVYVDEFHRMFSNQYAAGQFLDMFKRARKWGLAMTGITQNIEELLDNRDARFMLANSDFLLLMNQTPTDAERLADMWHLSPELTERLGGSRAGEGILKSGDAFIPFDGRIPADSLLYRLFTTRFGEA
ncbi:hypothetical protein BREU_2202 [Bifidobacterium reuteri DSM 23975]|uniref:Helicase HerA central domain-containing protein n=1 Tax=Bifidobacterium reuteri DSM 23975 TaxID=1437610 RepID=A0A087CIV2_9BIFI|nr:DUF87 domain-containing protein [Bifidobacterium reuteri]KFI83202.1 hypothetical protein BREU_2202 [Bifidobacterium reuteri DSM 23975]